MTSVNQELYQQKLTTPEAAVNLVEPGDGIVYPLGAGEPAALHKALGQYGHLEGNRLYTMLTMHPILDFPKSQLRQISFFLNSPDRKPFNEGKTELVPTHFSEIPNILKAREPEPVIMATVSPMDEEGNFSLGVGTSYVGPLVETAKTIIIEVNENMPRTFGVQNTIHISQVNAIVENHADLPAAPEPALNDKDLKIGKIIADMIEDGDTIQIGIGAMPNAVMENLKDKRDLGLHSEMFTSKAQLLHEAGVLTNKKKQVFKGQSVATFAFGPKKLYEFMDNNPDILMVPCNISNGQKYITQNNNFVSINSGVEVDFLGQVNAERVGNTYYSSTGGQADFTKAVNLTVNGKGIICLYSTAKKGTVSTIVPKLHQGAPSTTSKNDIDTVVTEYGAAELKNKTISERVAALIEIAHPDFREALKEEAIAMGYFAEEKMLLENA